MAPSSLIFSVGLEIHARLKTTQKIFCSCANHYGDAPNTNTCPVCLGLPGSLPVLNSEIILPALRTAVALNCEIPRLSEFSRKNYFYPDLPRNYQITQYQRPLALGGHLDLGDLRVRLQRIHLEEDAGRSLRGSDKMTHVDLNRAGTPLMEIVTEPDLQDGQQARGWLTRLRQLLRYLDVCDGNMETGSLRCDANVGLSGPHKLAGPWIELKNLNSFKAVAVAVDFEIKRLDEMLANGVTLRRETRAWDPRKKETTLLRVKEEASDYRYYPEPDLPLLITEPEDIQAVISAMPELPHDREKRFSRSYGINPAEAVTFCRSLALGSYFESCVQSLAHQSGNDPTDCGPLVAKWVLGQVLEAVGGKDDLLPTLNLQPKKLAEILKLLVSGKIHRTRGRLLIQQVLNANEDVCIADLCLSSKSNDDEDERLLEELCLRVLVGESTKVEAYKNGKVGLLNYFVGQVMMLSKGLLEAEKVRSALLKKLN